MARRLMQHPRARRRRGAAAVLAMMFLVIFSSLAAAMAIVAQGNLATADSHLKISRSLAGAETGMRFMFYRINKVAPTITTRAGVIDTSNAPALWTSLRTALATSMANELHNLSEPVVVAESLTVGPIAVGPGEPTFTATLTPHPIAGEDYASAYYSRAPYSTMTPAVSTANPLDSTWIRLRVVCSDGPAGKTITRSIQVDMKLDKKIKYAVLSKSRLMIGRNVMIEGPVGSRYNETNVANGHPIQFLSDFGGLDSTLDTSLSTFYNTLTTNDANGDNRLNVNNPAEVAGITNPSQYDRSGDGYIDDYDFFAAHYDTNNDGVVSATELNTTGNVLTAQLMKLVDTMGDPARSGYNDGQIDAKDRYAKIRGQINLSASLSGWQTGAASNNYLQYLRGPVIPEKGASPLVFESTALDQYQFEPADFDMTTYRNMATGDLAAQATAQAATHNPSDPNSPKPLGTQVKEGVPYGSPYPYDYYDRPVYENMTFTNVKIPKGSNALFKNCKFVGCTFVETTTSNTDQNFNYVGMLNADGTQKHPDKAAVVNGSTVSDTKPYANNIRFDGCTIEGGVMSDAPPTFTTARNKLSFTGQTTFNPSASSLSSSEKTLFERSSLLVPHYSVEVGTFVNPNDPNETVNLTGTIVTGVLDMRGKVKVDGSLITTYQPQSNTGPVLGTESADYNTTLGYFAKTAGDQESELPASSQGLGIIQIRYNPSRALPYGILAPVQLSPTMASYTEGG